MKKKGFTLIEMLTVVLIVGILLGVALPQYRRAIQKAYATEAVAMLRVILDSSERLSNVFGYKTFHSFATANPTKAVFTRMDMFGDSVSEDSSKRTLACTVNPDTIVCERYTYYLHPANTYNYVAAVKNDSPYQGLEFRLSRATVPTVTCGKSSTSSLTTAQVTEACDLYGFAKF